MIEDDMYWSGIGLPFGVNYIVYSNVSQKNTNVLSGFFRPVPLKSPIFTEPSYPTAAMLLRAVK